MSLVPHIKNPQKADHETPSISENGLVFKSPTTSLWVGSTGSGKTNAMLAAIAHQAQWRKYDQIFLMSPNVEATQKGEYSLLEVTPLTEWPPLKYFEEKKGRKLLICDDNALIGLPTKGGTDSQRNRADRCIGHGATHCNISVMIAQQMMTNIPPSIRRLAGVIVLFPHRIAHESIPLIAKSCMIPKKYMYQMFEWTKQTGPYGFLLIENDPVPGRARCRINGERAVLGIT
eukprot:COSAG01_NODE_7279_length_3273_cov_7.587272_2_plen_231_part_00